MSSDTSMSSLQASLASLIHWLASEKAVKTNAISGLKYAGLSGVLSQDGSWLRTYQGYLQPTLDGSFQALSLTWTRWGIVWDGQYTGLVRSAHRTSVNASSLWPTILASDAEHGGPNQSRGGKPTPRALACLKWPTPTAIDSGSGRFNTSDSPQALARPTLAMMARKDLWPTPKAQNANGAAIHGNGGQDLQTAVQHWPTLAAQDGKNSTLPPSQESRDTLPGAKIAPGTNGLVEDSTSRRERIDQATRGTSGAQPVTVQSGGSCIESGVGRVLDGLPRGLDGHRWPASPGQAQEDWEPPRTIPRRQTRRSQRLKALGNAIVPQQIFPIFRAIVEWELSNG